jgi:IrrE N-terminal-like domain
MLETRVHRTAEKFWKPAGDIQSRFPRDIESAVAWSLPLFVVRLPRLWVHDVECYLRKRRLPVLIGPAADRRLHGCVLAIRGKGLIIVDGTDKPPQVRFTIAHEAAHFMLDYQEPRLRAVEKLGENIQSVLDGERALEPEERVDGLLANAPVGLYTHFMHRDSAGFGSEKILEAESQADQLAFELIAPEAEVWRMLPKGFAGRDYEQRLTTVRRLLVQRFGLSSDVAPQYAASLCRSRFGGASVREWLGMRESEGRF